jgi:hypothetical protein
MNEDANLLVQSEEEDSKNPSSKSRAKKKGNTHTHKIINYILMKVKRVISWATNSFWIKRVSGATCCLFAFH